MALLALYLVPKKLLGGPEFTYQQRYMHTHTNNAFMEKSKSFSRTQCSQVPDSYPDPVSLFATGLYGGSFYARHLLVTPGETEKSEETAKASLWVNSETYYKKIKQKPHLLNDLVLQIDFVPQHFCLQNMQGRLLK